MSYQFMLQPKRKATRSGPALMLAALVAAATAGYVFTACGDRQSDRAEAGEPVVSGPVPAPAHASAPVEQPPTVPTPTTAKDFYAIGRSAWKNGDFAKAESSFTQAITLDSSHVKSRLYLSRVLLETGRGEDALVQIQAAIALDSTSSEPLRLEGRAFEALGRTDDAIGAYKRALVIDDHDVWAMNNLGLLYVKLGRSDDALGPIGRAIELEKNVATFHYNLGVAFEKTGRYTAALDAYRAALAVEGTFGPATTSIARVEELKEDPTVQPVDLAVVVQKFVEEIGTWKQQ